MLNQTPLQYYRMLRMNAARQMVIYSRDSLSQIAGSLGYSSQYNMAKHYQDLFGVTPREERLQSNRFRLERNSPLPSV